MLQTTNFTIFGAAVSNRPGSGIPLFEQVTTADRSRGLAGGGTSDYADGPTTMQDVVGCLAEKWATPDPYTWVLDIRQGVHFAITPNSPGSQLVNGREMTADDVVASLEFIRDTPSSWARVAEPVLEQNMTVEKTGPWQVTVHTPQNPNTAYLWIMGGGGSQFIWPKEWLPQYGTDNDWRVQVGTGPFVITDFVDNSVLTMARNNNYWDKNPIGPGKGDQLPYLDGLKYLIVPDTSTQVAALRTGKAEMMAWPATVSREDAQSLMKTNPQMNSYKMLNLPLQIGMRRDNPDKPYSDIRVRQALMMATDMQGILNGLFGGEGELLDSPARKLYSTVYTPLDQLPADTQELYTYNPDKAKQLLAEAGYPDGFKATMVLTNDGPTTDMAQAIKAQWAKVGVDVNLQLKDPGAFMQIWSARNYDDLMMTRNAGGNAALYVRYSFGYFRGTNSYNISYVDDPTGSDPVVEKAFQDQAKVINVDFAACDTIMKGLIPYILSQAFLIPTPANYVYRMWQPWLKDYYGESATKYWTQYVWLDQSLKKQMAGG